jgi:hypothetical protein
MEHTPTPWTDETVAKVEAGNRAGICSVDYYAVSGSNVLAATLGETIEDRIKQQLNKQP